MTRADRHSRLAWGVLFTVSLKSDRPMLLGERWHDALMQKPPAFEGQCGRTLLFHRRKAAREWCAYMRVKHADQSWRFRPVKVRETVRPVR